MTRRFIIIFSAVVLLLTMVSFALPSPDDMELYGSFIRLHVIADSDSEADQSVKLLVRDRILELMETLTQDCSDVNEAAAILNGSLDLLESEADSVLKENGFTYGARAIFGEEYYPTREYCGMNLPAGVYKSLRISLGRGEGHNWWCVLFPPLCTDAASAKQKLTAAGFTGEQIRILTDGGTVRYKLKFRFLELIGELFGQL